ncbi:hypothetical protein RxyAA322_28330 [Rubrobacter xylanophilus]|uniref:SnoaL-like domain-containing protein n=1 Tax=Rubrobacter xylanophilus TaxID=49319 RepID=A0A510HLV0_9ACTN|nr:nuclear transport factor 2 family protein [Rubrobacter xylanophilus]BBL80979.1 hypothetical protein RxyAA322_28330 [Rubrobacter xylanophilus]
MMERQTAGRLDFEELRRASEQRDAEALARLYAEDAELRIISKSTPPSKPRILRGRQEISAFLHDVCGREMTHRIENEVVGEGRVAFNEACQYADGVRVLAAATLEVRGGEISRQLNVEVWDE